MGRFSCVCVPIMVVVGCLEVGEKFRAGWWGGGGFLEKTKLP